MYVVIKKNEKEKRLNERERESDVNSPAIISQSRNIIIIIIIHEILISQFMLCSLVISIDTAPLTSEPISAFVISIFLTFRLYLTHFTSGNFT